MERQGIRGIMRLDNGSVFNRGRMAREHPQETECQDMNGGCI